jgi:hypothetical protein
MKIEIIGSGCPTCKKLHEITQKVVSEIEGKNSLEYITGEKGIERLIELGAMASPALAVNGKIAMVGFTPDVSRIKAAILKAAGEK